MKLLSVTNTYGKRTAIYELTEEENQKTKDELFAPIEKSFYFGGYAIKSNNRLEVVEYTD